MFTTISRTINEALKNFIRNGWLSLATSMILMLSLYTLSILFIIVMVSNVVIKNVQEKSNISIYFNQDVDEETIFTIQQEIEKNSLVSSVTYINKDDALDIFKKNNANEEAILKSIEEIGSNPLLASLVVKAYNPTQYQAIYEFVNNADFSQEINRINYIKNKEIIDKLNFLIDKIREIGLIASSILAISSILITFNSIRITIYSRRKEMQIMRLVGASNLFIRLPYIFEGVLYGLSASILSTILLLITVRFISPYISESILSQSFMSFFLDKLWLILIFQIITGSILGVASSMIAIRRYLKS
jgi:cell division transport system permease protein